MSKKLTTEEFIEKAKNVHGNKYDYSKVEYINANAKICIICPIHGEFWQTPSMHINEKQGCPKCANNLKYTTEEFIRKAKEIHGDKYDYSKVEYVNAKTKVCIICPIHGEFWQIPSKHLVGDACPYCAKNIKLTTEEFIERAKQVHGDKYDYSKTVYTNAKTKVCIICPIHGEFWQFPHNHLYGRGCKKCLNLVENTEEFIRKAKEIHGSKYDYSKVEYVNTKTKVCIICPIHGEFWQKPNHHLSFKSGCPKCKMSHLEEDILMFLKNHNIDFVSQFKTKWLGKQTIDYYIPKYNVAIECQGKQHFGFGGWLTDNEKRNKSLELVKIRDERKRKLCEEHGIRILYYSNLHIEYPYQVFEDKEELLKEILK